MNERWAKRCSHGSILSSLMGFVANGKRNIKFRNSFVMPSHSVWALHYDL